MFKKLFAAITVLTASVFFAQSGIASESHSVSKVENVKAQGQNKGKAQKKAQVKKQLQKKNTKKKGGKK